MKYTNLRRHIKSGDVLAWTHRSWRTWYDIKVQLIRLFTLSEYSHVGIAVVMGGRVWVLEAVTPKVRLVPLSNLLPCYHVTGKGMSPEQVEVGLAWIGREDVEYSQLEAAKTLFGLNARDNDQIQCAELVNIVLGNPCKDTPSAVVDYFLGRGSVLTEVSKV